MNKIKQNVTSTQLQHFFLPDKSNDLESQSIEFKERRHKLKCVVYLNTSEVTINWWKTVKIAAGSSHPFDECIRRGGLESKNLFYLCGDNPGINV